MTWVYVAKPPHSCEFPDRRGKHDGSIWRCGECGTYYELDHRRDYPYFRKLHRQKKAAQKYGQEAP